MPARWLSGLRNHAHVLLIVPLVVIVMTWPTFARIFDGEEFWLHTRHHDLWLRVWDGWHIERVLSGQAELFHTDALSHPRGLSLAFVHYSLPHALLFIVFGKIMPADSAYNLLFLLILCFNAYCAYPLILHLIGDKWIALFGAAVVVVSVPFPFGSTLPDLIMIGTIPLTVYFLHRFVSEYRWNFAALAGICAGATAFISVYIFVFNLMTVGILALFWSASRWKQPDFWRGLLLFLALGASISAFRFYPMTFDASVTKEGLESNIHRLGSNDVLDCCVVQGNPITGDLFQKVFTFPPDSTNSGRLHLGYNTAYLGYINLFLILCAIHHKPLRRKLAPWLAVLISFSILRLGHWLTINGQEFRDTLLPEHYLTEWFPALFGSIYIQEYYQFGVIMPLAILASFGMARLVRSKPVQARASVAVLSLLILAIEFYIPIKGQTIERDKLAYNDWLSTEPDSAIRLINLPQQAWPTRLYFQGMQTFNDYPIAFGFSNRLKASAVAYAGENALLNAWNSNRSVHCLPHNMRTFLTALDRLLEDGFTHVPVHIWLYGDQFIIHSFRNIPPAYDDGLVSVYRLRDLRLSCDSGHLELAPFRHFAESPSAIPGLRSSILSYHPSESIDDDLFAYLASLFSDWHSLLHLYFKDGELIIQNAGESVPDLESFARDNQVIYLIYNRHDMNAETLPSQITFEGFNRCRRDEHEDGAVIEQYLSREFSCALVQSGQPLQVDYDNGARLGNTSVEVTRDFLEIQFIWSNLPSEPHSVSLQIFDADGAKVLGQDSTIGHVSLARHRVDISSLPPGKYAVKLIVYNFNTRVSVPGTVIDTGAKFQRELEIATFGRA